MQPRTGTIAFSQPVAPDVAPMMANTAGMPQMTTEYVRKIGEGRSTGQQQAAKASQGAEHMAPQALHPHSHPCPHIPKTFAARHEQCKSAAVAEEGRRWHRRKSRESKEGGAKNVCQYTHHAQCLRDRGKERKHHNHTLSMHLPRYSHGLQK
jgi:hypothetical protein